MPNPHHIHQAAQRVKNQHGAKTATVVIKEYLQGHTRLGDNEATRIAKETVNGDTTSLETLLNTDGEDGDCGCGGHKKAAKGENGEPFTRVNPGYAFKATDGMVIYGPGSVSIVDSEGDQITGPALKQALPSLLRRKNLSLEHMDIQPGEIMEKWEAPSGEVYKTEVREVTKDDLSEFPRLKESGAEPGDDALFVVAKIWDDTEFSRDVQEKVRKGELECFSISGQAVSESTEQKCEGHACKLVNVIDKLDLSAVTLCEQGMNAGASFQVLSKAQKEVARENGWMQKNMDGCPGGFHGLVETVAALADEDEKHEALRKRGVKMRSTLDGHDPEDEQERELYGVLAALVDAAEEGEAERVEKLYKRFSEVYMKAAGLDEDVVEDAEADPEVDDSEIKAEGEMDYAEEGAEDMVEAEDDLDDAMVEGDLEAAEDAAELVEHHAEDLQELEKAVRELEKQLPPKADHDVVEHPHGTPSNPGLRRDHGRIHEDSPLAALDAEYNSNYPADADRLEGAGGRTRAVSEGEREDGELSYDDIEKSVRALVAKDDERAEHELEQILGALENEEYAMQDDIAGDVESALDEVMEPRSPDTEDKMPDEDAVMKPAPEGVPEDEYDSCVEQVEEEGDAENAHAVCADALKIKAPPHNHRQNTDLHKQAMAEHGWDAIYNPKCPTCFKLAQRYDQPRTYFDAARHLRKTGALRLGWLSPADVPRFRMEWGVLARQEIPTVGSA